MNIPDKFELYIENKLSEDEKISFERDLQEQPELAELYNSYLRINRIMKQELYSPILNCDDDPILKELSYEQRLAIEDDFNRFSRKNQDHSETKNLFCDDPEHYCMAQTDEDNPLNENKGEDDSGELHIHPCKIEPLHKTGKWKTILGITAAVLVFAVAGKIFLDNYHPGSKIITAQEAYVKYYHPNGDKELKSLNFSDERMKSVFYDYKRSQVTSGEIYSNEMEASEHDYELSLLYLGVLEMERINMAGARKCFMRMLTLENPTKIYTAKYYMALTWLSEGNLSEAEELLSDISKTRNPYQKPAKSILRSVKEQ